MTKILVAVLTSGKPEKLKRCLRSVNSNSSPHERIVVINTTDTDYTSLATKIAFDHGFPVHIAESNGTPGHGKNSVINYFLKTDNDWLFQIDGDDYISDGCISRLHYEIEQNEFDVSCLIDNLAVMPHGKIIYAVDIPLQPSVAKKFFKYADQRVIDLYLQAQQIGMKKSYDSKGLNRLLLINKKVAKVLRFNDELKFGEDFLFLDEAKKSFKVHTVKPLEDDFVYMYDYDDGIINSIIESGELVSHLEKFLDLANE